MDILRFITAGSVDDGKSTLIGRLLHDSKSILRDQLETLKLQTKNHNSDDLNLALLTDGLRAEREQGITIDIAYKYFSTKARKFIIADAPGHAQYTRNMVTGASNSDLAVLLIDARKGIIEQSRRHTLILSLLGISHLVVAINKIDLVDYSSEVYTTIEKEFKAMAENFAFKSIVFIPISALKGDNVVEKSPTTNWYKGPTLLEFLETVEIQAETNFEDGRFPIQYIIRSAALGMEKYKGYAGRLVSGSFKTGEQVRILPAGLETTISSIENSLQDVPQAYPGQSVVLHFEDDFEISRGDLVVSRHSKPLCSNQPEGILCWMGTQTLTEGSRYLLQINSLRVEAEVREISYKINISTFKKEHNPGQADLNDLVYVKLKTDDLIPFDSYRKIKGNGGGILIDKITNATMAAFMIA